MIHCKLQHLLDKCRERGYSLSEVQQCIVSQNKDNIIVDENHPSYPKYTKFEFANLKTSIGGPGTELKRLLSKIGIKATPSCSCNSRAKLMDAKGIEWCENNIDTIISWLREEANKRRLPFIHTACRILVKRAISNAKKNQQ